MPNKTQIRIPTGQKWFTDRREKLGYSISTPGLCWGIAHMAMQAILVGEIHKFDKRQYDIYQIPLMKFADYKEWPVTLRKSAKIRAYFDGVELYHNGYKHSHLFTKTNKPITQDDFLLSAPLALSRKLEAQGGIECSNPFSGIYNQEELEKYFTSLQTALIEINSESPVALILSSCNHSITISYDAKKNQWLLIDANHLPTQYISSINEIASKTLTAFISGKVIALSTQIYAAKKNEKKMNSIYGAWVNQKAWQEIHQVDQAKAQLTDSHTSSWLYVASSIGDNKAVTALLAAKANVDLVSNDATPIFIACQEGHADTVLALLAANADATTLSNKGVSPLFIACQHGHLNIVKILIAANVNVNVGKQDITPLFIACQEGFTDIVLALLAANADTNISCEDDGTTPLFIACQNGHIDIVKALLGKKADVNLACIDGETPLFIACREGNINIVTMLLAAKAEINLSNNGATPLFIACQEGRVEIVKLLLENGADISSLFKTDVDSLREFARDTGVEERMEQLITSKKSNEIQISPKEIAMVMGHKEIIDLLNDKKPKEKYPKFLQAKNEGTKEIFPRPPHGLTALIRG